MQCTRQKIESEAANAQPDGRKDAPRGGSL